MKYTKLTDENQRQMLEQRQAQYEQEHYNHEVNLELLISSGVDDEATKAAIQAAKDAMKTLDDAHSKVANKLNKLNKPPKT